VLGGLIVMDDFFENNKATLALPSYADLEIPKGPYYIIHHSIRNNDLVRHPIFVNNANLLIMKLVFRFGSHVNEVSGRTS